MEKVCGLFGKCRRAYYCHDLEELQERELNKAEIIRMVHELRGLCPGLGCYKLWLMLQDMCPDIMIGRDRFYRLMHIEHLVLKPLHRRHTTDSNHNYRKYKNLLKTGFRPTAPSQLWVSDITYITTEEGVRYLHLITDAYTREIIGWTLSETLQACHTLAALEQAIAQAGPDTDWKSLIHHSDRGVQYCCNEYVGRLLSLGIRISMTEDYCPTDNALAERVNGIIKQEWLYRMKRPEGTRQARELIRGIVDFYNKRRPHMSIGMKTPAQMRAESNSAA